MILVVIFSLAIEAILRLAQGGLRLSERTLLQSLTEIFVIAYLSYNL